MAYKIVLSFYKFFQLQEVLERLLENPIQFIIVVKCLLIALILRDKILHKPKLQIRQFWKSNKHAIFSFVLRLIHIPLICCCGFPPDEAFRQFLENAAQNFNLSVGFLLRCLLDIFFKVQKPPTNSRENGLLLFALARCYYDGEGVQQNHAKAASLFYLVAENEIVEAQYYLGIMFLYGKGVPRNYREAYIRISLAATEIRKKKILKALKKAERKLAITPESVLRAQDEALKRWEEMRKKQQRQEK